MTWIEVVDPKRGLEAEKNAVRSAMEKPGVAQFDASLFTQAVVESVMARASEAARNEVMSNMALATLLLTAKGYVEQKLGEISRAVSRREIADGAQALESYLAGVKRDAQVAGAKLALPLIDEVRTLASCAARGFAIR